jgi:quercetin 2,3-dioxygenase
MARSVQRVDAAVGRIEADGLPILRALPIGTLVHANPFVLVEEVGPVLLANPVETVQRPAHGFEEVTWSLVGPLEHVRQEPGGRVATAIAANRAEWLTTGRGDVYSERFLAGAGVRALRVWISLPRADRRVDRQFVVDQPGTDELQMWTPAGAYSGQLQVDLLAGRLLGARPNIQPHTRVTVARLRIPPDTTFIHAVDSIEPAVEAPTVLLYGLAGQAMVGPAVPAVGARPEQLLRARELAVLAPPAGVGPAVINSDEVRIHTGPGVAFDALWLSGLPVGMRANETFVQHGTVVMRTEEEVLQAIEDYRTQRLGTLV